MADPRFFQRAGPFPLARLAEIGSAMLHGDADQLIHDVASIEQAGPDSVVFYDHKRHLKQLEQTQAAAVILREADLELPPASAARLIVTDPYRSYGLIAALFYPSADGIGTVSPGAHVDPTARLGPGVTVAAGAVVEAGAEIGAGGRIGANAVIGANCVLGERCIVHPGATLAYCLVGRDCIIHPGARIGQDGFGFALGPDHQKVPQLGRVLIGDEVEIGANSTIDRGSGSDTVIGSGTKIDNLVQIAHNVVVGEHCVIVSLSGVSGSAELGHHVIVAAQCGITGHLTIGAGARLAARTAVIQDLPGGADYGGAPALPAKDWRRQMVAFRRLGRRS